MFRSSSSPRWPCVQPGSSPSLASAQTKVGVVNFQKAILDTADIKKASEDLQEQIQAAPDRA